MNKFYILALDIGTSSVRASIYDDNADPVPRMFVKNERSLNVTPDGGAEIDADEALNQVIAAIDEILAKSSKLRAEIKYVAISSFWHSLVGVDAKGRPVTKVFGWADTRSRKYTDVLRKKFDESSVHNRTGARFHSSFWPAKLMWIRKESPSIFEKTAQWLGLGDYIALKLFGDPTTSLSTASGTGIFDIRICAWDAELLRFLKIKAKNLPLVASDDSAPFALSKQYSRRWPRLSNARWFVAIADGVANNVGSGCVGKSTAALMIGTSGAMRVVYQGEPPKQIPSGLWCYRVDRKRVILGGALSDGGGLYHWLQATLRLDKRVEDEVAKRAPASHGLTFLPFLAGERSTGYHESAKGSIIGLTSATDSVDMVQAAFESVAYRFAEIFDQLNSAIKIKNIVASGGALRDSHVWTQIIADVLGRDLWLPETSEASSRGVVLLALESIGKIKSIEEIGTGNGPSFKANRERFASYRVAKERHTDFYKTLIGVDT